MEATTRIIDWLNEPGGGRHSGQGRGGGRGHLGSLGFSTGVEHGSRAGLGRGPKLMTPHLSVPPEWAYGTAQCSLMWLGTSSLEAIPPQSCEVACNPVPRLVLWAVLLSGRMGYTPPHPTLPRPAGPSSCAWSLPCAPPQGVAQSPHTLQVITGSGGEAAQHRETATSCDHSCGSR